MNRSFLYAAGGALTLMAGVVGYFTIGDNNSTSVINSGPGNNVNLGGASADSISVTIDDNLAAEMKRRDAYRNSMISKCENLQRIAEPELFEGGIAERTSSMTAFDIIVNDTDFVTYFGAAPLMPLKDKLMQGYILMGHWMSYSSAVTTSYRHDPEAKSVLNQMELPPEFREKILKDIEQDQLDSYDEDYKLVVDTHNALEKSLSELCETVSGYPFVQ